MIGDSMLSVLGLPLLIAYALIFAFGWQRAVLIEPTWRAIRERRWRMVAFTSVWVPLWALILLSLPAEGAL